MLLFMSSIFSVKAAINEATGLTKVKGALLEEKEEIVYRCYLAMGQLHIVLNEISDSPSVPVGKRALKLMAQYLDDPSIGEIIVEQLNEWLSDTSASSNRTLQTIAASLYILNDNINEGFRVLGSGSNLEQLAILVQQYLRINRSDLAASTLKTMKGLDEEGALTMLCTAWVNIASSPSKAQEAVYIFEELIDKYGGSITLLNGLAVAKMHLGLFDEAEVALKEAIAKAPADPDSLANLITVSYHLQRPQEVINRYLSQLRAKAPKHDLVTSLETFERAFDRAATALA
eukprot:scaffold1885_cov161-Ochromonas_danica.AAC.6